MGKRKTLAERALEYRMKQGTNEFLADVHWRAGYLAGHRANRISAAERRVVEAAVAYCTATTSETHRAADMALGVAVAMLQDKQRAKGGGNG